MKIYDPIFLKKVQSTKYQFYRKSEKVGHFYTWQMLGEIGYPPPISVTVEDEMAIFLHTT